MRFKFWQNAHVRAMCVRPKIECANVRACEAKNRRNSQTNLDDCVFLLCVFFFAKEPAKCFFCSLKFSAVEQADEFNFLFLFLAVFVVQGRIINLL